MEKQLARHITNGNEAEERLVKSMGGTVFKTEIDEIYDAGIEEGRKRSEKALARALAEERQRSEERLAKVQQQSEERLVKAQQQSEERLVEMLKDKDRQIMLLKQAVSDLQAQLANACDGE